MAASCAACAEGRDAGRVEAGAAAEPDPVSARQQPRRHAGPLRRCVTAYTPAQPLPVHMQQTPMEWQQELPGHVEPHIILILVHILMLTHISGLSCRCVCCRLRALPEPPHDRAVHDPHLPLHPASRPAGEPLLPPTSSSARSDCRRTRLAVVYCMPRRTCGACWLSGHCRRRCGGPCPPWSCSASRPRCWHGPPSSSS